MEIFKQWASTLCITVIFISLAHIMLNTSIMKNHVKFALSLILLSVMIVPIVKFLSLENEIDTINYNYKDNVDNNNNKDNKEVKEFYNNDLLIENLEKTLSKTLKNEYSTKSFNVSIKGKIDFNAVEINIDSVLVEVEDNNKVKKVQKVVISKSKENKAIKEQNDEFSEKVKKFISEELKIEKNKINVVYI